NRERGTGNREQGTAAARPALPASRSPFPAPRSPPSTATMPRPAWGCRTLGGCMNVFRQALRALLPLALLSLASFSWVGGAGAVAPHQDTLPADAIMPSLRVSAEGLEVTGTLLDARRD